MTLLDTIIARKKQELEGAPVPTGIEQSSRSLVAALSGRESALIAEVKLRSPSAGDLLESDQVPSVVDAYNRYAQAISVLCDSEDFGGGYGLLAQVRSMTDLPILAKEFIIDPLQICMVRKAGADAVLLIGALLIADQAQMLAVTAFGLGMDVLFEVHDPQDIAMVPDLPSTRLLLGINNRDLQTLAVDLTTTEEIAPLIEDEYPDHLRISESGIRSRADIERLSPIVDGFLIGETFLRAKNADQKIHELFPS